LLPTLLKIMAELGIFEHEKAPLQFPKERQQKPPATQDKAGGKPRVPAMLIWFVGCKQP